MSFAAHDTPQRGQKSSSRVRHPASRCRAEAQKRGRMAGGGGLLPSAWAPACTEGATVSRGSRSWNGPTSARRLEAWWWCQGHSPARDTLVLPSRPSAAADPERSAEDTGDVGTRRRDCVTKGKAGRAPAKSPRPRRKRERKRERGDRQTEPTSARVELCV